MTNILLTISMASIVLQNTLFNYIGKNRLTGKRSVWIFNSVIYVICFLILLAVSVGKAISVYTVLLGLVFGLVTIVQNHTKLLALSRGPMHITQLITTASLVIPSLSGIFIDHTVPSIPMILLIFVLVFFIYLSLDNSSKDTFGRGWLLLTLISFTGQAAIGVMQKIHQASSHADESSWFLTAAFLCSAVFAVIRTLTVREDSGEKSAKKPDAVLIVSALICGICIFIMNTFNLKLSGIMPSHIFFPLVNGGVLFLNILASLLIFRERITLRQGIGIGGGFITLVLICLV
nr:hypothetical protein [Clostridia bacterium]